uniref:Uncharacterized protein n=1 Tax=Arundo donax TaxID=35708 RepID=A0A0A9F5S1_ARUDO
MNSAIERILYMTLHT